MLQRETVARAMELTNELPPHERRVFVARAVKGLTPREVAETAGLQTRSVINIYCDAKRHLRRMMTKEESS